MNEEARERLRTALRAVTPPPRGLRMPELESSRGWSNRRWRELAGALAAVLLAALVVGTLLLLRPSAASHPASHGGPLPAATATPPVSPSQTPPAVEPSPAPVVVPTGPPPRCHTGDLKAALTELSPGAGQRYAALTLTNQSGHPCQVYGYVGTQLLDATRAPVPTAVVRNPSPGPQAVELAQGASAFTVLHWTVVPGTGDSQSVQCQPQPALVQITPPDETTQLTIPWTMSQVCLRGRLDAGALSPGTGPGH